MTEELPAGGEPSGAENAAPNPNDTVPSGADTVQGGSEPPAPKNEFSWNDYVTELSTKDEKVAKQLERFSSVDDLAKSFIEARKTISQGFKEPELPEKATEEQIAEYRKKVGIPDSPDGYKMPEGLEVKDADKPLWDLFLQNAHNSNLSQKELAKVAPAYYAMEKALLEQQAESVKQVQQEYNNQLREMWGTDVGANININEGYLAARGGDALKDVLAGATDANGVPLLSNPAFAAYLQQEARDSGFANGIAVGDKESAIKSAQERYDELMSARTGRNRNEYYSKTNKQRVAQDTAEIESLLTKIQRLQG